MVMDTHVERMDKMELWEKCIAFHGHRCGGLAIGYKAALLAIELLCVSFSTDEEIVCVAENDACGTDAIQVILGCSVGKGNLLFRMRGKQAFSFFDRRSGNSARLVLRGRPRMETKEESFKWLFEREPSELFDVKEVGFALPEQARILQSISCEYCGEITAENMIRLQEGKKVCLDCYQPYSRFNI